MPSTDCGISTSGMAACRATAMLVDDSAARKPERAQVHSACPAIEMIAVAFFISAADGGVKRAWSSCET